MFNKNTDKEWEKFGRHNPYYGVISNPKYIMAHLSNEKKQQFFKSGNDHIERILGKV